MKTALKVVASVLLILIIAGAGAYVWASTASGRILSTSHASHTVEFVVPFPSADTGADAASASLAQAIERGRHLLSARYSCTECHGENMAGGVMVDAFPIGSLLGPNLTTGAGSRTLEYTAADWDRAVRHGILPDGRPSIMPSEDFHLMSDQELSDIIAFIRSLPAVDNTVPAPRLGPLGKFLVASGTLPLSVDRIGTHDKPHRDAPPAAEPTIEFGQHLAATCTGCHGPNFAGGKITGGDPSWPPARNLTPHADALGKWTYDDFASAMRTATRPDGTPLQPPMTLMVPFAQKMTDTEMQAIWAYLRSVPAVAPVTT